jgi:diadenosine tetraphosphate (Ap4A) HIT family hydrolase
MLVAGCLACDVIAGRVASPGGTLYDGERWRVTHSVSPVLLPGFLILAPKRHVEHIALLDSEEMREFGPLLRNTCRALAHVLHPIKVYVSSFGESVSHVHFYVVPRYERTPEMPAGFQALQQMFEGRWAASDADAEAAELVEKVRPVLTDLMRYEVRPGM